MHKQNKPRTIALGSARKLTKTDFKGDLLEIENPILARQV